jgi:hypothetical protein
MENILISGIIGFGLGVLLFIAILVYRRKKRKSDEKVQVFTSIEEIRQVGELVAFKIVTKEIVTAADHWFGDIGKKYFLWLISTKKMAMIFEFSIDFKYDLRSPDFTIQHVEDNKYRMKMPKCFYDIHIKDINFYDEQTTKLLPWLLPDLINKAFGMGFDEKDKNRLVDEAKQQASRMAVEMVQKLRSDVQSSARQTLETITKGFGGQLVAVDFSDSELVQFKVESPSVAELEQAQ